MQVRDWVDTRWIKKDSTSVVYSSVTVATDDASLKTIATGTDMCGMIDLKCAEYFRGLMKEIRSAWKIDL